MTDKYKKADFTRLKNLLRAYRDHAITNNYNKLQQSPHNLEITKVIELVDNAISLIITGL